MTSVSSKLGLVLPSGADPFSTSDIHDNWTKIDTSPGAYICTSSTRPSWTVGQAGRKIIETNTGLEWWWDGAFFRRTTASGLLKTSNGAPAIATITSSPLTVQTPVAFAPFLTLMSVVVPDGHRPLSIVSRMPSTQPGTNYGLVHALIQSGTANGLPVLADTGFNNVNQIGTGNFSVVLPAGLNPGTYDFSVQVRRYSQYTQQYYSNMTYPAISPTDPMILSCTEL